MNVKQCVNGHFFDVDSYSKCPHCNAPVAGAVAQNAVQNEPKAKKKFIFNKKHKEAETVAPPQPTGNSAPVNQPNPAYVPQNGNRNMQMTRANDVRSPMMNVNPPYPVNNNQPNPVNVPVNRNAPVRNHIQKPAESNLPAKDDTLDFWSANPVKLGGETTVTTMGSFPDIDIEDLVSGDIRTLAGDMSFMPESVPEKQDAQSEYLQNQTSELQEEIKRVSANDDGKTMSYFSIAHENSGQQSTTTVMSDPVVGWLVAISGKHLGESFCIYAGRNSVGRGTDNRIVLGKDGAVSRGKHAVVIFEPKKRKFYLQPGDSNGLIYLHEEFVSENKELKKSDIIEIGESRLLFVPLCDENFSWEDYIR